LRRFMRPRFDGEPPAKRKHTIFVEMKDDAKDL
jgi:hypothetical protein